MHTIYKLVFGLLFLLINPGCTKQENQTLEIYGHAAMGLNTSVSPFPSNSASAILLANSLDGLSGIEVDVRLSADSTFWLLHDSDLSIETFGAGCLESKTDSFLKNVSYLRDKQERITPLDFLLQRILPHFTYFLDLKIDNTCEGTSYNALQLLHRLNQTPIQSFPNIVLLTNSTSHAVVLAKNGYRVVFSADDFMTVQDLNNISTQLEGLLGKWRLYNKENVRFFKESGKSLYLYTVQSAGDHRKISRMKPTGLLTDDVFTSLAAQSK